MTDVLRAFLRYATALVLLAVVAQVAGAAYGGFYSADKLGDQSGPDTAKQVNEEQFDHGFSFHTGFGYAIFIAAVVLFLIALGARIGRPRIWWYLGLPLLMALQIVLAWAGESTAGVGILHGINALVIFSVTATLAHRAWRAQPVTAP